MAGKKSTSKALVKWDEQLAKDAEVAAAMEANTGGGQFFSLKSGVLSWQDAPLPGNEMAVVILDSILENVFYEGRYDADNPRGPTCFAFGRDDAKMTPHKLVVEAKNQQCGASGLCQGCPQNEFGTAEVGRGKACKNTRRLALIPAGNFDKAGKFNLFDDAEHFENAAIGYMKLPVTSVKGYAGFVKQVVGTLRRPPHGIVTRVRVVPDNKDQFKVVFEPLEKVPDELMGVIMKRHEDAMAVIDFPYQPNEEEAPPARGARRAAPTRQAAPTRGAKPSRKY
jgi:hypothetical protein